MPSETQPIASSPIERHPRAALVIGWILTLLPAPLLIMSATMKFLLPKEVADGFEHLGWPTHLATTLGILELGSLLLFLIPRTAVFGAILLTGYMGGAIATHVRIGEPFLVQTIVP